MQAAHAAFPAWRARPAAERARAAAQAGDLMQERVYDIAAALTLEVGKNRMEALGEAQETVDFFHHTRTTSNATQVSTTRCRRSDRRHGLAQPQRDAAARRLGGDRAVQFPVALAGGPVAAALVTGNTVVFKSATDTPWSGRLLAEILRDAGFPAGTFNYLSGIGSVAGEALARHPLTAGITFTGSVPVGRQLMQKMASGAYPRPCIAEMGGKNPCIVTEHADLDRAAAGIARSAFGMGGQKCSALSRLYVHEDVADALIERLGTQIDAIQIGDARKREHWLGPVVNAGAYDNYARFVDALEGGGARLLRGGRRLRDADAARGYYVEPVLAEADPAHPLWKQEMFLPIMMLHRYRDRDEAMRLANDTDMGLTAGFYGGADEVPWFQEHIEAGVTYANRPQGATTGAWPGYQPFGGWKGSGSTGKAIASFYYLQQYLREQSRTVVE
jgi:1-pyrroline-5-carboxylate dehydrogenase